MKRITVTLTEDQIRCVLVALEIAQEPLKKLTSFAGNYTIDQNAEITKRNAFKLRTIKEIKKQVS